MLGHEVTVFASGDSRAPGKLRSIIPRALASSGIEAAQIQAAECQHVHFALASSEGFDILHDHTKTAGVLAGSRAPRPMLTTAHNDITPDRRHLYLQHPEHRFAALSRAHAARMEGLRVCGVVPNGVDVSEIPFEPNKGDYLLFLGRLDAAKGADRAARLAAECDWRLLMAGPTSHAPQFFASEVQPWLNGKSRRYIGEVDGPRKWALLGGARALLFPIRWPEPFGLVMVEALATGTPVLATDWGAVREVVAAGRVGEVASAEADTSELAEALARLKFIRPEACRTHVERYFSVERMTVDYMHLYQQLLSPGSGHQATG
jgi:glycosyltransferase involved in cell wall biosynthesis